MGGAANTTTLLDAKKAIGRGVETTFAVRPVDNLLVTLSANYNFTSIKDPGLSVGVCAQRSVTNPTGTVNGQTVAFIDGNALPNAPKWIDNVNLRYRIPNGNGGEYFVFTDWSYRSKVDFFLHQSSSPNRSRCCRAACDSATAGPAASTRRAAFARNITNQVRVTGAIDFNNPTGFINDPRTVGVRFKALF